MAGILLGAMPWATCWSRYHRRCKKKIQTNPHNTSAYPRSEWQADQTTGKRGFLVSMQTGFSPDHHLQSIALHSWWWSPRSPLSTEMRSWKQSWGDGPSTFPFPGSTNPRHLHPESALRPEQNPPQSSVLHDPQEK